jgi:hypothetical protein
MSEKVLELNRLIDRVFSYEMLRKDNLKKLKQLYKELEIIEKIENFNKLFEFKALNISGIFLTKEKLFDIQEKKYLQVIGIKNVNGKMKNINIKYYGRVEKVDKKTIEKIGEFVIRWRLEKAFLNLIAYKEIVIEHF